MSKAKILIVEDEGLTAFALQRKLRKWGYEVPSFTVSGKDAVQKVSKLKPDLVLLDINLKGEIDGLEAAEEIIKDQETPVIFTTAYDNEKMINRAYGMGASGYITKPYEEKELKENIQNILHDEIEDLDDSKTSIPEPVVESKDLDEIIEENETENANDKGEKEIELPEINMIENESQLMQEDMNEDVNLESNDNISKKMSDVLDIIHKRYNIIESHVVQTDGQVLYSNMPDSIIQPNILDETLSLINSSKRMSEARDNNLERMFLIGDKMQILITLSSDIALIFSLEPDVNIGMVSLVMKNAFSEINGILNN